MASKTVCKLCGAHFYCNLKQQHAVVQTNDNTASCQTGGFERGVQGRSHGDNNDGNDDDNLNVLITITTNCDNTNDTFEGGPGEVSRGQRVQEFNYSIYIYIYMYIHVLIIDNC